MSDDNKSPAGFGLGRLTRQLFDAAVSSVRQTVGATLERELDADRLLRRSMSALIELAAARYPIDPGAEYRPGHPLELLLVGYSGTRNTGADVRVEEIIRQLRHLLGDEHLRLSLLTIDPKKTRGYFRGVRQLTVPKLFPKFVFDAVHAHHGVVACEGSMFKSKFANALTTFMVGAIGVAGAEHKLAIGYGAEAGAMDPELEAMVHEHCRRAVVIARNQASLEVLARLEIEASLGTDTAWTFAPHPPAVGRAALESVGWDGRLPVVIGCPINPFWWPVTADLRRGMEQTLLGLHGDDHFASLYFHRGGEEVERRQADYVAAFAGALEHARRRHDAFVVLVGMEALDRRAAEAVASELASSGSGAPPLFVSDEHDHRTLVSILRTSTALVSSRYHAIVTAMPAGVPAVGVTMDERITNLLGDAGLGDLCLQAGDPTLQGRIEAGLDRILAERESLGTRIEAEVVRQLHRMGVMGRTFIDALQRRHPELPVRDGLGGDGDPLAHLPPLGPDLQALLDRA